MTRRAFIIGHPIAHSRSPQIHRYWLARHGIDGSYEPIDIAPADLPAFLDRVRAGEFAGGNVTIPLKETVLAACEELDPVAEKIGAVNMLVGEDGKLIGRNSDVQGFLANLDAAAPGWEGANAIVLGAGGGARAVIEALVGRGFTRVSVLNRTPSRAALLASRYAREVKAGVLSDFVGLAPSAALLVNSTSVGMGGTRFERLPLNLLQRGAVVCDLVYAPLETPLLKDARALGLRFVDGLGMLLHQAAPGFAAWFGVSPEVTPDLRALIVGDLEAKP
ncbi:MAG: shikimate dehydrogenase [Cucumibacter sp.]